MLSSYSINYWIQQWINSYLYILKEIQFKKNVYLICYESLCNQRYYYKKIIKLLDLDINLLNYDFNSANYKYDSEFKEVDKEKLSKANDIYNQLKILSKEMLNFT